MKNIGIDEFIKKAKIIHLDKYNYSLTDYKTNKIKVKIICPEHGIFEQTPQSHLNNNGCPMCAGNIKYTTSDFIKNSNKIHNNKYDYSLVDYKTNNIKVKIICTEHGIFEQNSISHIINKRGCPICSNNISYNTETYIEKAKLKHGDKYDYSLVDYKNSNTKINIICSEHGTFNQNTTKHLKGQGCPMCSTNTLYTTEKFIEKAKLIHGNKYDYSLVDYKRSNYKVKIICPTHDIFEQSLAGHINNSNNCPMCKTNSKGESEIHNILSKNNIYFEQQKKFKECKNISQLPFDFYIPKYNLAIEYDGRQHFNINTIYFTEDIVKNDKIKTDFCYNNNIKLLRIKYNENIKEKIKTIIL